MNKLTLLLFLIFTCIQNYMYAQEKAKQIYKNFPKTSILYYYYQRENFYHRINGKGYNINMHNIVKLESIKGLAMHRPNLRGLDLRNCPLKDISELSKLKDLRSLSLLDTKVTDVSPLKDSNLLDYFRTNTPIKNLEMLPTSVEYLGIGTNKYSIDKFRLDEFKVTHPNTRIEIKENILSEH